jgi:hypothetical protein
VLRWGCGKKCVVGPSLTVLGDPIASPSAGPFHPWFPRVESVHNLLPTQRQLDLLIHGINLENAIPLKGTQHTSNPSMSLLERSKRDKGWDKEWRQ